MFSTFTSHTDTHTHSLQTGAKMCQSVESGCSLKYANRFAAPSAKASRRVVPRRLEETGKINIRQKFFLDFFCGRGSRRFMSVFWREDVQAMVKGRVKASSSAKVASTATPRWNRLNALYIYVCVSADGHNLVNRIIKPTLYSNQNCLTFIRLLTEALGKGHLRPWTERLNCFSPFFVVLFGASSVATSGLGVLRVRQGWCEPV